MSDYTESSLVRMEILVNAEPVDAFSTIVHREKAEARGRVLCSKLKEILPRQLFKIALQAAIGGKVIAQGNNQCNAKRCYSEVLRWRYLKKTKVAG